MSSQGTGFMRNPFHEITIAGNDIGEVIYNLQPRPVETCRQPSFSQSHPYGRCQSLAERFTPDKYQLMLIEMFPHHIIHAECVGGDIDLLSNRRATIGFFPWRFVDGESSIGRCVAFVDDDEYDELMARKAELPQTRFGDCYDPAHVEQIDKLTKRI